MQELDLLLSIQYDGPQAFDLHQASVASGLLNYNKASDALYSNSSFLHFDMSSKTLDLFLTCQSGEFCSATVTAVTGIYVSAFLELDMHFFEEQGRETGFADAVALHLNISNDLVQIVNSGSSPRELMPTGRYSSLCSIFSALQIVSQKYLFLSSMLLKAVFL